MNTSVDERNTYSQSASRADYDAAGMKRPRSPSSPYGRTLYEDDPHRSTVASSWDSKRARSRDQYERGWGGDHPPTIESGGGGYSPDRNRRAWHDLDPDEKEREWQRYEREREYDRFYSDVGRAADDAGFHAAVGPRAGYDRPPHLTRHEDGGAPAPSYASGGARVDHYSGTAAVDFADTTGSHARMLDPMDSPTMLSYKQYTQILREIGREMATMVASSEATQALYEKYQEYRNAFHHRAMAQYWRAHKDERWFVEKYSLDADATKSRTDRRRQGRRGKKSVWLGELRTGALDKVCCDAEAEQAGSSVWTTTTRFGERETVESVDMFVVPSQPNQLLIRSIPPILSRTALEKVLREERSFHHLALGEPHPLKGFSRVGCVVFDEEVANELSQTAARLSQKVIEGQKLSFEHTTRPAQAKARVMPEYASTLPRMLHDLRQARRLVQMLEREDVDVLWKDEAAGDDALTVNASHEILQRSCAIVLTAEKETGEAEALRAWLVDALTDERAAAAEDEDEQSDGAATLAARKCALVRKSLDLHIDLLRQAYICDYYTSTMADFPEELLRRAPKSMRRTCHSAVKVSALAEKDKLWASNVDLKHQLLMRPDDNAIGALGGTDLQAMLLDLAAPYSREDEAEKHRCVVKVNDEECGKPFKAQIFVQKHVLNKHRDFFHALHAEKIAEAKYFNNYVRDPQRCMPPLKQHEREGREGGGALATSSNGGGHHRAAPLTSRMGGYDHTIGAGPNGDFTASSSAYYGPGNLVRLGGTAPAWPMGRRPSDSRERLGDSAGSSVLRLGSTMTALPNRRPARGISDSYDAVDPQPSSARTSLDPRAKMAPPKSYQDLDAGVPSGGAELDLEY